jgi:hypothetical protein
VRDERVAQPLSLDVVPIRVTPAMEDGAAIVHAGVTLRPPRQPGVRGGGVQHRIEWIDPDTGKRRQASWVAAQAVNGRLLDAPMGGRFSQRSCTAGRVTSLSTARS